MPKLITGKDTEGFVLPNYSGLLGGVAKSQSFSAGISGGVVFSDGTNLQTDPANLFWDDSLNRLGVGTNVPVLPFHASVNNSNAKTIALLEQLGSGDSTLSYTISGQEWITGIRNNPNDNFAIKPTSSLAGTLGLDITTAGRVGINSITPTQALQVSGAIALSGANTHLTFGTKGTAPTLIGSGSIFLSGGTTNTVGVWLLGFSGNQTQLGSYI